jgi:hypothetical protein
MSSSEEENEKITRTKKPLSEARLKAIEKMKEGRKKQLEQMKKEKAEITELTKKIKKEKKSKLVEETSMLNNLSKEELEGLRQKAIAPSHSTEAVITEDANHLRKFANLRKLLRMKVVMKKKR